MAGDNVDDVHLEFGNNNYNDFLHVYSAYLSQMDYFVTNDLDEFIKGGRRERLEALMPGLKIRTMDELLAEFK